MQQLKKKLAAGEIVTTFAVGRVLNPVVIEMFGLAGGYEGFWLDAEHVAVTSEQMTSIALAGRANGLECFARIPPTGYWQVTQCLESGFGGVMAAQIRTADEAAQFVEWAKFAPQGGRGLNIGGRDANYTHLPPAQFVEQSNEASFVAIQIETAEAVEEVDAIAALDGVDLLFVGPADLSLALGVVGQFHHERLWNAIEQVAAACRRHGKTWGAVMPDPDFAKKARDHGCQMPTIGHEVLMLRRGIETVKTAFGIEG